MSRSLCSLEQTQGKHLSFCFDVDKYEPSRIPAHQRFVTALRAKRCRIYIGPAWR
jgi:hypothetical protein